MTKWALSRPSSRSHTAYDSTAPNRTRSQSTQQANLTSGSFQYEKQSIIHDAFANFISKKQKIGQNFAFIKRKGRHSKGGLRELASHIAQAKPLEAK